MAGSFADALAGCLASVPKDRVVTCGAAARTLGDVRAARAVATWILEHPDTPGAERVVRADGRPVLRRRGRTPVPASRFAEPLASSGFLEGLRAEQRRLEKLVRDEDDHGPVRTLGAVDVAYRGDQAYAAAVRCDRETLDVLEIATVRRTVDFPYIPTYLAFRELPPAEAAVRRLREPPDLLLADGHGRLHPTRFGFACFLGVRLDLPTVGVAKHPLVGRPQPARRTRDGALPVTYEGAVLGYAWVPPRGARPIYVSVGHRVSLGGAFALLRAATRGRIPEPLAAADRMSKQLKARDAETDRESV